MSALYQKLLSADQVCNDCGNRYGKYSVGCSSMSPGTCDVCGQSKAVTEPRDFGYLAKGIAEIRAQIKEQSKEVATYMEQTKDQVTYKSAITGICIYRKDQCRTLQTEVKLVDEGSGEFISIMDDQGQEVRLDFEEFEEVVKAVATLRAQ
jgi:hypothetical protein